jgi:acyl dehydratase
LTKELLRAKTELKEQNTTGIITLRATIHNQSDVLVFEGSQRYLIRKRVG